MARKSPTERKWCRRCQQPKPIEQFDPPRLYCEPCRSAQDAARKPKPKSVGSKRRTLRRQHAAEGRIDAVEAVHGPSAQVSVVTCLRCERIMYGPANKPVMCECVTVEATA